MSNTVKEHIVAALRRLMDPIIRILLRNGVTYKEFALLCKNIFVEAAAQDFGIRGRPTNVSRISVLTGIDRKEVKRIKDLLQENVQAQTTQQSQDRLTRILSGWHQDADFLESEDNPKALPIDGENSSFTQLAKRYGGDIPANALLKELLRAKVVEELPDGRVKALQRYYFPSTSDPEALLRAGSVINELASTLFHNLYEAAPNNKRKAPRFERRATNNQISEKHHKAFREFLDKEGQAFLERVDDWLTLHEEQEHEKAQNKASAEKTSSQAKLQKNLRLGVGVYFIEDEKRQCEEEV